jgi:hypothetical protein
MDKRKKRHRNVFLKMGISKNGGNWHLEGFLCYFTCLNLIFAKILGNFQLGHHCY